MAANKGDQLTERRRVHRTRGEDRRKEILDGAIAQFSQRGIDSVTVEDIAQFVGCNKSLIYYYFDSKEGLSDAVMEEMVAVNEAAWAALHTTSFADWVSGVTGWPRENPMDPWIRLCVREGLADSGRASREEERGRVLGESTRNVVRAQGAGQVDPELDPEMVALLIFLLSIGPAITPQYVRMLTDSDSGDDAFQQRYGAFISALVKRLRPTGNR